MTVLGALGFTTPWLLWSLLLLPALWILLRAVPPAPIRRQFPAVTLLLGLKDSDSQSDRTPWWLLLLRILMVSLLIIGLAGPVLNPKDKVKGTGPLLILLDGSWADAADWSKRQERVTGLLEDAHLDGRAVDIVVLSQSKLEPVLFQAANSWQPRVVGLLPNAWVPDPDKVLAWANAIGETPFETVWLSDGISRDWRAELLNALQRHGVVSVLQSDRPVVAVSSPRFEAGKAVVTITRASSGTLYERKVLAIGRDPAGAERVLARQTIQFAELEHSVDAEFELPPELLGRIDRFALEGTRSAGAVALTDDALRRREVALISGRAQQEGLRLLSPLHYLQKALAPTADLLEGTLTDILPANPDVIIMADVATLPEDQSREVAKWVANGGTLLRFAGPRMAASDLSRDSEDPLMPVRLRRGGRSVGGALSWGEAKHLRPFPDVSPFFGLVIPDDVQVTSQVVAQPDPALSGRTIAMLSDGTPLVTRKFLGDGQVVLFHVTANAEWSNLPLSGLFVEMLERLAISGARVEQTAENLAGTLWAADFTLNGFGEVDASGLIVGIAGEVLATAKPTAEMPPGLYASASRSEAIALNAVAPGTNLSVQPWPANVEIEGMGVEQETALKGWVLLTALVLLVLDSVLSLWLSGRVRLSRPRTVAGPIVGFLAAGLILFAQNSHAQITDDQKLIELSRDILLAHVVTGDAEVDRVALAGLRGLSDILRRRTAVEPDEPVSINLETDEYSFLPFLYWPITHNQPLPSEQAYVRLNTYLQSGGLILFDTRDAGFGAGDSAESRKLRALASRLDIPPLEVVPNDHVLTRSFYLLQDFPGRHSGRGVWVEAAPPDAVQIEGMPFRNLNDGVTPVVIGGNDWAAAWAIRSDGGAMFPVGRGFSGERQREVAYRFGVNLIMHALTGNYKSDQVHVPALLDRLGQ